MRAMGITDRPSWMASRATRRSSSGSRHFRGSAGHRRDPTMRRMSRSAPGLGVIAALHSPYVTHVDHDAIRLRGLEEVQLEGGKVAAVLQEWLVSLM